ncbi:MAG TPA: S9 family peptidase [Flavobacteriales bacterium]|nr:S9 family peptidase [Flavobacteriales bacterium]
MLHHRLPAALLLTALALSAIAQKPLTNREIWASPTFSTEFVGGLEGMRDGEHYTALEERNGAPAIVQYAYRTGQEVAVLVEGKDLVPAGAAAPIDVDGYSFSADEKKVMLRTGTEQLYRYSYFAEHHILDRATRTLRPLSDPAKGKQRLATFSPDGSKAAFVRDNDLYVVDLGTLTETRVTSDGALNRVINGATDWVYEEEFALVQGYEWSPAGTQLLFLRTDETAVPEFDLTYYENRLYPREYRFKYPKAGEQNSTVSLYVYDTRNGVTRAVGLGETFTETYIPRFGWTTKDDVLWYMLMDRLQQTKVLFTAWMAYPPPPQIGVITKEIYRETSRTYVEVTDDLHFLEDGSGFILTSEKDGWNHIQWCSMDGKVQRALTQGEWDVLAVQGVDAARKRVLFTASKRSPREQEVYAVGLSGKGLVPLSPPGGFNDAEWSEGFRYFINTRSTASEPPVITLLDGEGKLVKTLKDNAALRERMAPYALQPREFFQFTTAGGVTLNGWMIKPPGFSADKKYPVFMTQYSGPNSNEVLDQWEGRGGLWHQLLAQQGYVVACVDPRGTGRRGRDFRHITYGQLGKYETEDQIAAAQWLAQQPYVDGTRIGIQGWSYGGYMSSLCITKGADVFKAAIAVAPVTNWRYYDSIYTERYMGLPQTNAAGYDDNSPINHVEKLKGKYLLIHGMGDDNVHFQNAAEMVMALIKANKPFDQFAYPDKNHGIYGGNTRLYLYEQMTNWLLENL